MHSARPQKVAYLTTKFPLLSETFIYQEVIELENAGHSVRFFSFFETGDPKHQFAKDLATRAEFLAPILSIGHVRDHLSTLRRPQYWRELGWIFKECWRQPVHLAKSLYAFCKGVSWYRELAADPPDQLHAHWATAPTTAAMVAASLLDRPFSFTAHAWDIYKEPVMLRTKLLRASRVFTISEYNQVYLERVVEQSKGKTVVVRCGIDIDRFPFRPPSMSDGPLRILAVARLVPKKGLADLIKACRVLCQRGIELDCRIVGDGPLNTELSRLIVQLGLENRVTLTGAMSQERLAVLWKWADVFVLPCVVAADGNRDGIPVALIEAMASGVPVISTRVSGIPELVVDRLTGLLVAPAAPYDLAAAIQEIHDKVELAERLTVWARRKIEREYAADGNSLKKVFFFERTRQGTQGNDHAA